MLPPRAITVLIHLRKIPRTPRAIAGALAETPGSAAVNALLKEMEAQGLIRLIPGFSRLRALYELAPLGITWLADNGVYVERRP